MVWSIWSSTSFHGTCFDPSGLPWVMATCLHQAVWKISSVYGVLLVVFTECRPCGFRRCSCGCHGNGTSWIDNRDLLAQQRAGRQCRGTRGPGAQNDHVELHAAGSVLGVRTEKRNTKQTKITQFVTKNKSMTKIFSTISDSFAHNTDLSNYRNHISITS